MSIAVSVIIPVYNADGFVEKAVLSALEQSETAEVILVEDGSPDKSWETCQELVNKYERVHLYRHPGGVNRGAGASRNLGMEKAASEYLAFLDADDFYLPGRFCVSSQILGADLACDGVYEAIGIHFDDEVGKQRWLASYMSSVKMTTLTETVLPEDLFRVLVKGWSGHIHLNGLVIRRSALEKSGYMDVSIAETLHEDTDFILRLAAVGRLMPGRLGEPVAMRRVHEENRVSAPRSPERIYRERMKMWKATYNWCRNHAGQDKRKQLFARILGDYEGEKPRKLGAIKLPYAVEHRLGLLLWLFDFPQAIYEDGYWRELMPSFIWDRRKV